MELIKILLLIVTSGVISLGMKLCRGEILGCAHSPRRSDHIMLSHQSALFVNCTHMPYLMS